MMERQPIRVLHIVPNMHAAGLETLIMNIYRNIDRSKVQFDFLTHYQEAFFYDNEIESLGGVIHRLSFREDKKIIKYLSDLDKFFRTNRYDIVHSHMASTSVFTLKVAKKYGVKIRIVHSHNTSTDKTFKGRIKSVLLKRSTKYANAYFACGVEAGKFLFGKNNFRVIHNAIELHKFYEAKPLNNAEIEKLKLKDKFVIGHVGRFTPQKNHTFLIKIFKEYLKTDSTARLLLIGEGECEEDIRSLVKREQLDEYIFFLGVQKNMPRIYKLFNVFLLPSLYEGLPVVGVESQAAGIPIIFSDNITKEVAITQYAHFESIASGTQAWVNAITNIKIDTNRIEYKNELKKMKTAGFDIKTEADILTQYYYELLSACIGDK